jgi:hypothetical protein
MAKFMEEVDGTSGLSRTNHVLRSVLNGDIESGRLRLARALEKLGYHVISEDPLYARRSARRWAKYYCSFDILDYPRKLKIGLKALSPNATLATFDYAAKHFGAVSSKGDLQTLRLEAEAIIALAAQNATITLCTACGTNQPDDSRFCRVCGAPNVGGEPAELEVLRLTAGARAGHHKIVAAVIWALGPVIAALFGMIFLGANGGRLAVGLLLAMIGNLLILLFVLNASRKTLKPDLSQQHLLPVNVSQPRLTGERALPSATAASASEQKYVTEGTTELLAPKPKEREKELVYRMGRDTSPQG